MQIRKYICIRVNLFFGFSSFIVDAALAVLNLVDVIEFGLRHWL